ncbi:MAG: DegT/DnrJ/EryC1/StrS family aminotransferase, partial [Betaproteobacteria bacterium]
MKRRPDRRREIPPTAGLPLVWRDLLPGGSALDQAMAGFLGIAETQIECSGTAALIVALTALSLSSSRRVVVIPAYTCPLVPLAIRHCGLSVRLCDLAPNGFDFDPVQLKRLCADDTLAIIPTHL